jgi:hypothetical protein
MHFHKIALLSFFVALLANTVCPEQSSAQDAQLVASEIILLSRTATSARWARCQALQDKQSTTRLNQACRVPLVFRCSPCDAGQFANETGLSACLSCSKGSFSVKSSANPDLGPWNCTLCNAGRYAGTNGLADCKDW